MSTYLLEHEPALRMGCFTIIFVSLALGESLAPRRARMQSRWLRWPNHFAIVGLDLLIVRLLLPVLAMGTADIAAMKGWGVLNAVALPDWLEFIVAMIVLDAVLYGQHVLFHRVPAFWRVHRVHHADLDFDVTTAIRFHPIEIALSMLLKLVATLLLGPSALTVVIFEVVLNGTAQFNHSNLKLPLALDRWLRLVMVTPDMHRVHHSVHREETDSNFGFNLPWWDRLFRTYRAQPRDGHEGMTIGLHAFRGARDVWLHRLLIQPFLTPRPNDA